MKISGIMLRTAAIALIVLPSLLLARAGGGDDYERSSGESGSSRSSGSSPWSNSNSSSSSHSGYTRPASPYSSSPSTSTGQGHAEPAPKLTQEDMLRIQQLIIDAEERERQDAIELEKWRNAFGKSFRKQVLKTKPGKKLKAVQLQFAKAMVMNRKDTLEALESAYLNCDSSDKSCEPCFDFELGTLKIQSVLVDSGWLDTTTIREIEIRTSAFQRKKENQQHVCDSLSSAIIYEPMHVGFFERLLWSPRLFWLELGFKLQFLVLGLSVILLYGLYRTLIPVFGHSSKKQVAIERGKMAMMAQVQAQSTDPVPGPRPDPEEPARLQKFNAIFMDVQMAWDAGDMGSAAYALSSAQYAAFQSGLALLKGLRLRNEMKDVQVLSTRCVRKRQIQDWHAMDIVFKAKAMDRRIHLDTGRVVKENMDAFSEVWTFIKQGSLQDNTDSSHCGNCGQVAEFKKSPLCTACGALRNSGQHGWVLSKITQEREYFLSSKAGENEEFPKDPNDFLIEDMAEALFWRYAESRLLHPENDWRQRFEGLLADNLDGSNLQPPPMELESFSVGKVTFAGGAQNGEIRKAKVKVKYRFMNQAFQYQQVVATISLECKGSGKTGLNLASLTCRNCGAARGLGLFCGYCNKAWPGLAGQWLWVDIQGRSSEPQGRDTSSILID